jgi:RNA polymerase sigma factor (sigma-70 family)
MTVARDTLEATFLENLPAIEKIAEFIARRHGLVAHDAEDFVSIVKTRLIENDYAILQKFRGESSLPTYIAVVVASIYRDYRVQKWGRWRPSAIAKSLGPAAVKLETLLYRDGYTFTDAVTVLSRSDHHQVNEKEGRRIVEKLPRRDRLRPIEVSSDELSLSSVNTPQVVPDDLSDDRDRIELILNEIVCSLSAQDQVLLRMKFWERLTIAEISRISGHPQKQLYRRFERIEQLVRQQLQRAGVNRRDVQELLEESSR